MHDEYEMKETLRQDFLEKIADAESKEEVSENGIAALSLTQSVW